MRTAYKVRAHPDPEQVAILSRAFGCVRVVWNRTLAARQHAHTTTGQGTSSAQTDAALTAMKRAKHPRFKSCNGKQSATYTRSAFRIEDGDLWLAKTAAPLRLVWTWPGLDLATLIPTAVTRAKERRLARYQPIMARKRRGSANRTKAKVKIARQRAEVADARHDSLHRASSDLIRRFDTIVEDLAVANMVRNRRLAKSISDSGCGALHDRDINAAKNILAVGPAVAHPGNACGDGVSRQGSALLFSFDESGTPT